VIFGVWPLMLCCCNGRSQNMPTLSCSRKFTVHIGKIREENYGDRKKKRAWFISSKYQQKIPVDPGFIGKLRCWTDYYGAFGDTSFL